MEKIFISNLLVYETPSEEAKGNFSAGLVVANRLNGNNMLVGTFNPNRTSEKSIKVGFVTFRQKFETKEEAEAFKAEHSKKYPIGSVLNPKEWSWGEIDNESTTNLASQGATVHFVDYTAYDETVPTVTTERAEKEQMQYTGKVTEPV